MPANSSCEPPKCLGTRCLISSKAHNVSESRPPANCTQYTPGENQKGYQEHVRQDHDQIVSHCFKVSLEELSPIY